MRIMPLESRSSSPRSLETYSFICIPKQSNGKFQPKIAQDLGCMPKLHFKLLTAGESVTLANGDIVHPFQVLEQAPPSQGFIFVFLPEESYLDSFLSEQNISNYQPFFSANIDSTKQVIHLIYHSVPLAVILNENYKRFMYQFGLNVKHVIDCYESNDEVLGKVKGYNYS